MQRRSTRVTVFSFSAVCGLRASLAQVRRPCGCNPRPRCWDSDEAVDEDLFDCDKGLANAAVAREGSGFRDSRVAFCWDWDVSPKINRP